MFEYSNLGQFLKNVDSLSLASNREKAALSEEAGPIGVVEGDHNWDFGFHYEWQEASVLEEPLTAEREVSYRYWAAGAAPDVFAVDLPFRMPVRGYHSEQIAVGEDGEFRVAWQAETGQRWSASDRHCSAKSAAELGFDLSFSRDFEYGTVAGESALGWPCTTTSWHEGFATCNSIGARLCTLAEMHAGVAQNSGCGFNSLPIWALDDCPLGHMIITFGNAGQPGACQSDAEPTAVRCCGDVYEDVECSIDHMLPESGSTVQSSSTSSCWDKLTALVPTPHLVSGVEMTASSQGAAYFSERFCPGWAKYVSANICTESEPDCDAAGNAAFDGGDDMYVIGEGISHSLHSTRSSAHTDCPCCAGNFMSTSLMGSCAEDLHGCPLGSLTYRDDFEPTATSCFGPGGQYRMLQTQSIWIFLSHNAGDDPLDFAVLGNLGSDGSGAVTEFVLEAPPFVGFVKRECADGGGGDPSVNHLIMVDGSGGLPAHSCDYIRGGECTGASSDLDDDILQGISPGSPILYLLYSSEDGYCVKEDEHRAIFDAAVRCLWADDPFAVVRADRGRAGAQPLVSVDVDERGEIVFGGTAAYTGWAKGGGPSIGADGALRFEQGQWLQLNNGEDGCAHLAGDWMLDVFVRTSVEDLRSFQGDGALLTDAMTSAALVGLADAHIRDSPMAVEDGWHRLTVVAEVTNSIGSGPIIADTGLACTRTGSQLVVNDTAGTIDLSDGYADNMHCDWLVCQSGTSSVPLKLVEFATEADYDFLELYEGAGTDSPVSRMSGDIGSQQTEYSLAAPVRIKFTSDSSVTRTGFRLEFVCGADENRSVFIDGMPVRSERLDWDGGSCISEIGRGFPLAIRGLQVLDSIAIPSTGLQTAPPFVPLPYHAENSRWVEISSGLDGVEIRWDTIGWERATHEQVSVALDPAGGITVTARNMSVLWDRAVASAGAVANDHAATTNWTSAMLNTLFTAPTFPPSKLPKSVLPYHWNRSNVM
eukprot:SAG22_NODE_711_length_7740_cov_3.405837_3_plen_988_part_00